MPSVRRRRKRSIRSTYWIGLFIFFLGIAGPLAYGQTGQPGEGEGQQQPETPPELMIIAVNNDLLSVELLNAEFGKVLKAIAKQKGFRVEISGDVSGKKLSTKFMNVDLERGILRLLTLVKEKNYTIHYDGAGGVNFVDVFGSTTPAASQGKAPATQPKPQIQRAITASPPVPVKPAVSAPVSAQAQPSRRPPVPVTTFRRPAAPAQPQPEQPQEDAGTVYHDNGPEEDVPEVPYIPSQTTPVYIPPRTK